MRRIAVLLLLAASLGSAHASTEHRVRAIAYNYLLPVIEIAPGDTMVLENLDRDLHTFTALDLDHEGSPLFDTPEIRLLETAPVSGIATLPPGTYRFYCRVHANIPTMYGTLTVAESA